MPVRSWLPSLALSAYADPLHATQGLPPRPHRMNNGRLSIITMRASFGLLLLSMHICLVFACSRPIMDQICTEVLSSQRERFKERRANAVTCLLLDAAHKDSDAPLKCLLIVPHLHSNVHKSVQTPNRLTPQPSLPIAR